MNKNRPLRIAQEFRPLFGQALYKHPANKDRSLAPEGKLFVRDWDPNGLRVRFPDFETRHLPGYYRSGASLFDE